MNYFEALLLGLIQGLTEILPISSSGHLVLTEHILGLKQPGILFELMVHFGTLLSVLVYFRKKIWSLIKSLFDASLQGERKMVLYLIFGTIPAVIDGVEISATNDPDNTLEALFQRGRDTKDDPVRTGAWIDGELSTDNGLSWVYTDDPIGMELHQFDLAHVTLHVHLPDEEEFLNISNLEFTGTISVIQYNEYEEP